MAVGLSRLTFCSALIVANVSKFRWAADESSLAPLLFREGLRFIAHAFDLAGCELRGLSRGRAACRAPVGDVRESLLDETTGCFRPGGPAGLIGYPAI
jgi:hypothetical protein